MRIVERQLLFTANITSETFSNSSPIEYVHGFSVHAIWTGDLSTMLADLTIQISNNDEDWSDLGTATTISDTSGNVVINASEAYYKYIRVKINNITDTVTSLELLLYGKGIQ